MSPESVPPPEPVPAYPPPPVPQKSSFPWKVVLIVGGIVLALCCVGAIIAGIFGFRALKDATGPASDAATSYYSDLKSGDYGSAYDRLCDDTQRSIPRTAFIDVQNQLPQVTDYKVTGVNVSNYNGKVTGRVKVQVTREGDGTSNQTIELLKEDGKWKVCDPGL